MTDDRIIPVNEMDYLDQDPEIRGQKYVCLSFISPEDVILQKEIFFFNKYLEYFSKDLNEFFETMKEKYSGDTSVSEMIKGLKQRYDYLFGVNELQETYNFFKNSNNHKLESEYFEKNKFQTSIRGIKIRGAYETFPEAQKRAEGIRKFDSKFDVYVAEMGCWCPWAPHPETVSDVEYPNSQLNTLMKKYKENMDNKDEMYRMRKDDMVNDVKLNQTHDLRQEIENKDTWSEKVNLNS